MPDPYDRYGIDLAAAQALTLDASIDDEQLHAAEDDLVDLIGSRPADRDPRSEALLAFGRAVAWQATHRGGLPAGPSEVGTAIRRESFPDHTVEYEPGQGPTVVAISPRAFQLLTRFGWYATSGYTHAGAARPRDPWRRL